MPVSPIQARETFEAYLEILLAQSNNEGLDKVEVNNNNTFLY